MALIPVFKKYTKEYLEKEWDVEFPLSEWVQAKVNGELYETNRYDIQYFDSNEGKTISVYLYMSEDSDEIYAIDEIVNDVNEKVTYLLKETPFADMLADILTKEFIFVENMIHQK